MCALCVLSLFWCVASYYARLLHPDGIGGRPEDREVDDSDTEAETGGRGRGSATLPLGEAADTAESRDFRAAMLFNSGQRMNAGSRSQHRHGQHTRQVSGAKWLLHPQPTANGFIVASIALPIQSFNKGTSTLLNFNILITCIYTNIDMPQEQRREVEQARQEAMFTSRSTDGTSASTDEKEPIAVAMADRTRPGEIERSQSSDRRECTPHFRY